MQIIDVPQGWDVQVREMRNGEEHCWHFPGFLTQLRQKEMVVIESSQPTLPKTNVECPKCLHNEAFWVLRQTRAADEPETKIYRCVKCTHSWREY